MARGGQEKFQMTNFRMPNKIISLNYALKSVPGLADDGVLHGDEDGPIALPRCMEGVRKKFLMTNFIMPNNISCKEYSLKLVPGLADVKVLHGDGDGPRTSPRCLVRSEKSFK